MSQNVACYNPFIFASKRHEMPRVRVEARFEKTARIRAQIESIDKDISEMMKLHRADSVLNLIERRNKLTGELP